MHLISKFPGTKVFMIFASALGLALIWGAMAWPGFAEKATPAPAELQSAPLIAPPAPAEPVQEQAPVIIERVVVIRRVSGDVATDGGAPSPAQPASAALPVTQAAVPSKSVSAASQSAPATASSAQAASAPPSPAPALAASSSAPTGSTASTMPSSSSAAVTSTRHS